MFINNLRIFYMLILFFFYLLTFSLRFPSAFVFFNTFYVPKSFPFHLHPLLHVTHCGSTLTANCTCIYVLAVFVSSLFLCTLSHWLYSIWTAVWDFETSFDKKLSDSLSVKNISNCCCYCFVFRTAPDRIARSNLSCLVDSVATGRALRGHCAITFNLLATKPTQGKREEETRKWQSAQENGITKAFPC